MKKLFLSAAILAALTMPAFAAEKTVRIGTEGAYPPYNFINDAGEIDGFDREAGDEMCKRAKLDCVWVKNDWDSIIPNLVSGNYDAIIAGMSITSSRDEVIDFTQNYIPPTISTYVGASKSFNMDTDIVAVQAATIEAAYIATTGAKLVEFATSEDTIAAVRNGEVDAIFSGRNYLAAFVEESNGKLMFVGKDVPLGDGVGVGLRESDQELRTKLNKAISSMKTDGTLNKLLVKWFGNETPTY